MKMAFERNRKSSVYFTILLMATAFLFSCHSNKETKTEKKGQYTGTDSNGSTVQPTSLSFFDSIAKKYEFTAHQIKTHTIIDSFYFTDRFTEAVFSGDTIFSIRNGFTAAVFGYNDRSNCSCKFLAVFPVMARRCSDHKLIQTECDRDISSNYSYRRYRWLSDSTFETVEYLIPANKNEDDAGMVTEKIIWKVDQRGMIDSVITKGPLN